MMLELRWKQVRSIATCVGLATVSAVALSACVPETPVDPGTTTTTTPAGGRSFVYVADSDLGAIRKIDTVTLATVATLDVGGTLGDGIALVGSKLFYEAVQPLGTNIGVFDTVTNTNNRSYITGYSDQPLLRSSTSRPGRLFVGAMHVSPSNIATYDVTGATGVKLLQTPFSTIGSNLKDFEVSSDGSRIWVASGAPYEITELRTSDLLASGKKFPTGPYPVAVASTTAGGAETIAAGAGSNTKAYTFQADNPAITTPFTLGGETLNRGIAVSRDGARLYVVNENSGGVTRLATVTRSTGAVTWAAMTSATIDANGWDTGDTAVDPATGQLFVTVLNSVFVYAADGTLRTTLTEAGPRGMAFAS